MIAEARRQHLDHLGQRSYGRLGHVDDAAVGRGMEPDHHRDGLIVVEDQRRQRGAGGQGEVVACPEAVVLEQ